LIRKAFTPLDAVLAAALIFGNWYFFLSKADEKGAEVKISSENGTQFFPLTENAQLRIKGPLGESVVEIFKGKAYIEKSPCPLKLCIRQGKIDAPGQVAACLPNRVVVSIVSNNAPTRIDAISR